MIKLIKEFEIIIVDNFSTDNTLKKAKNFNIKKIVKIKKYLPGKAINEGIKVSSGELIVMLFLHCLPVKKIGYQSLLKLF